MLILIAKFKKSINTSEILHHYSANEIFGHQFDFKTERT